jgi:hypothetical protein
MSDSLNQVPNSPRNEDGDRVAVSRRTLLNQAGRIAAATALGGVAAAALAAAPAPAEEYAPREMTITLEELISDEKAPVFVGRGEHTYVCQHDWLTPPDSIAFGDTHGLAQDSQGRIYVAHTVHPSSKSDDAICVFDADGKFLTSWGARFKGGAHGLDLRREADGKEYLYHCDVAHKVVVKTTLTGEVLWETAIPKQAGVYTDQTPFTPTNVAFGPDGSLYVTDGYGSDWITQFDKNGDFVRVFGGKGSEPGKVSQAHGIWLDSRGSEPFLVVADRANSRLQYFTLDGKHVKFVTNGMRRPCHLDIRGDLVLVPDLSSVITLLDRDNKVVAQLGDGDPTNLRGRPRSEYIPGKFIHPHDAMFLKNGDILVAEWVPTGRITRLQRVKRDA